MVRHLDCCRGWVKVETRDCKVEEGEEGMAKPRSYKVGEIGMTRLDWITVLFHCIHYFLAFQILTSELFF